MKQKKWFSGRSKIKQMSKLERHKTLKGETKAKVEGKPRTGKPWKVNGWKLRVSQKTYEGWEGESLKTQKRHKTLERQDQESIALFVAKQKEKETRLSE